MKNKKGEVFLTVLTVQGVIHILAVSTAVACLWHIPAWSKAKREHKEAEYQAQRMWPQGEFAKLPGGDDYKK